MNLISTAYFGRCVRIMADTSKILGKTDKAKNYDRLFGNIQTAFCQ